MSFFLFLILFFDHTHTHICLFGVQRVKRDVDVHYSMVEDVAMHLLVSTLPPFVTSVPRSNITIYERFCLVM